MALVEFIILIQREAQLMFCILKLKRLLVSVISMKLDLLTRLIYFFYKDDGCLGFYVIFMKYLGKL